MDGKVEKRGTEGTARREGKKGKGIHISGYNTDNRSCDKLCGILTGQDGTDLL